MKEGWREVEIGRTFKTSAGGTPLRSRSEYFDGGTIPWLMSGEVGKREVHSAANYLTDKGLTNSSARMLPVDTVLVAMYGATAGQVGVLKFPACTNQAVCGIHPHEEFDPGFVYYAFLVQQPQLIASAIGNAQPNLSQIKLRKVRIPAPPLPEQQRIVRILDEAFATIAIAKANAEKNVQNARAVFESHLNAVFSQRGERWVEKRLDEVAKVFGRGKSRHRPRNEPSLYGGKYPFIQTGDVRNAQFVIDSYTQTYSEVGLAQSKLWPEGTVCITIAANIAETAILGFEGCIPDSIIGVVVDDAKANNKFVLYLLKSFKAHLQAQGKGSAQDNINMGTFENQSFPFPRLSVQREIVATLDSLVEETQRLESIYQRKLAALDELKKSLLHHAFSGDL